jgi:hypothetical protein
MRVRTHTGRGQPSTHTTHGNETEDPMSKHLRLRRRARRMRREDMSEVLRAMGAGWLVPRDVLRLIARPHPSDPVISMARAS